MTAGLMRVISITVNQTLLEIRFFFHFSTISTLKTKILAQPLKYRMAGTATDRFFGSFYAL